MILFLGIKIPINNMPTCKHKTKHTETTLKQDVIVEIVSGRLLEIFDVSKITAILIKKLKYDYKVSILGNTYYAKEDEVIIKKPAPILTTYCADCGKKLKVVKIIDE